MSTKECISVAQALFKHTFVQEPDIIKFLKSDKKKETLYDHMYYFLC